MNATRKSSIMARPSTYWPMLNSIPPLSHHVHVRTTAGTNGSACSPSSVTKRLPNPATARTMPVACSSSTESVRCIHWMAVPIDSTTAAAIEAMPTSDPCMGSRLPNRMITKNAAPGMTGISHAFSRNQPELRASTRSAPQLGELVERDGAAVAVHEQDHRQPDAHLGGGDGDHVQGEHLPVDVAVQEGEGDEVEVDGVEDQFDRHQHHHRVAPGEHAVHPDAEQHRPEQQEVGN